MPRPTSEIRAKYNALAMQEYRDALGKLFRVGYLCGYQSDDGWVPGCDCTDVSCSAIVRVTKTAEDSVLHWNDEWLDPYWEVELIEGDDRAKALRSIWIDGPSHNTLTGEREWKHIEPVSQLEGFRALIQNWINRRLIHV